MSTQRRENGIFVVRAVGSLEKSMSVYSATEAWYICCACGRIPDEVNECLISVGAWYICFASDSIREEVDECLLSDGSVGEDTYANLEYTKCVVREALRMFPPLLIDARSVQKEVKLTDKYTIPKVQSVHDGLANLN